MQLPDEVICYNRLVVGGVEALCILLKRFASPNRYSDMCPRFARPVRQLSMITSEMLNLVYLASSFEYFLTFSGFCLYCKLFKKSCVIVVFSTSLTFDIILFSR